MFTRSYTVTIVAVVRLPRIFFGRAGRERANVFAAAIAPYRARFFGSAGQCPAGPRWDANVEDCHSRVHQLTPVAGAPAVQPGGPGISSHATTAPDAPRCTRDASWAIRAIPPGPSGHHQGQSGASERPSP